VARAHLALPAQNDNARVPYSARSTDPKTIAAVLRLLDRQSIVDNRHACASGSQPTAKLTLAEKATPGASPMTSDPPVPLPPTPAAVENDTRVVITLGDSCREAISSRGGRVRLDEAAFTELTELFGLRSR
jgi:hypothetical protein